MNDQSRDIQLNEYVLKALEGTLSDGEFAELDKLLARDPAAARSYVEFMTTYIGLRRSGSTNSSIRSLLAPVENLSLWEAMAEAERNAVSVEVDSSSDNEEQPDIPSPSEFKKSIKQNRNVSRVALFTAITSIAALLIMLAYLWTHPREMPPVVATLTHVIDAQWESSVPPIAGSDLRAGPMILLKGLARIRFDCGAEVVVQAPCHLEAISMDRVLLVQGKLTANVPKDAIGFTVNTPNAKVVDLGTEFGVEVRLSGISDVHVFDGEVALCTNEQQGQVEDVSRHLVSAGFAMRVNSDKSVEDVSFGRRAFVRKEEFNMRAKASAGSTYHKWLLYSDQLRYDIDLVAYYTFDNYSEQPDQLINVATSTEGKLNGIVNADISEHNIPTWSTGRWPRKGALKFDRANREYMTIPHNPELNISDEITICAWVKREGPQGGGHIVSKRMGLSPINFQYAYFGNIEVYGKNHKFQFGKGLDSDKFFVFSRSYFPQTDHWQHVAVSFNGSTAKFYLDGRQVDSQVCPDKMIPNESDLLIGTDGLASDDNTFHGLIDELAIFKRSLSGQEIRRMYEAGNSNF